MVDTVGKALRAGWAVVVASIALSMATSFGITLLQTPVYESRAQMFLSTSSPAYGSEVYEGNLVSDQALPSYAELVNNEVLTSRVVSDLALDLTPAELAEKVTMSFSPETVLFDIVATDSSPELARDIANATAEELVALVLELEAPQDGGIPVVSVKTYRQAEVSDAPISPNTSMYLACGAAVGLFVGVALVLVRSRGSSRQ
ncbi:YveK family protein [Rhodococcus sp. 077-4]|uniref:YveK family protein n=1 Tax=Rhodococcus sp. 077-4 TaxID=2789271 RepID=UPI0039F496AF